MCVLTGFEWFWLSVHRAQSTEYERYLPACIPGRCMGSPSSLFSFSWTCLIFSFLSPVLFSEIVFILISFVSTFPTTTTLNSPPNSHHRRTTKADCEGDDWNFTEWLDLLPSLTDRTDGATARTKDDNRQPIGSIFRTHTTQFRPDECIWDCRLLKKRQQTDCRQHKSYDTHHFSSH